MSGPNDDLYDWDGIKQQLQPILKSDSAIDHFTENPQIQAYKGPSGHPASNIVIAVPGYFDWLESFDTSPPNAPIATKVTLYRGWVKDVTNRVSNSLDGVFSSYTGAALLKEINRGAANTLTISPTYDDDDGDITRKTNERDDSINTRNRIGVDTTVDVGELMLSPKGFAAKLTPYLLAGEPTDEILLHELIHAAAFITGNDIARPIEKAPGHRRDKFKVDNAAEFLAVQIANIYRQEKGRKGFRFNHSTGSEFDGKDILQAFPGMIPSPEQIIKRFAKLQPKLFDALAAVPPYKAKINVMRQVKNKKP
jgi:hypothetical protein